MREEIERELVRDEAILWIGSPATGLRLRRSDALLIPFSIAWCGFAIFWEASVVRGHAPWLFKLWGIPFVVIGLHLVIGRFFVDAKRRAATTYAVTDQRVLIVSRLFGRRVVSLLRTRLPAINLVTHANGRGTISFGTATRGQPPAPALEMVADPKTVMELLLPSSPTGYRTDPVLPLASAKTAAIAGSAPSMAHRLRLAVPLIGVALFSGFFVTKRHWKPESVGQVTLHMYFESQQRLRLPLPPGWRARRGYDRHDQCAILLDSESIPRFFACTHGYPDGTDRGPTGLDELTTIALRASQTPGGNVESATHQTPRGPINTVTRTHSSSATFFGVVKSGRLVDVIHMFVLDGVLVELKLTEDAADRATLDPIALQLARNAQLVR